MFKKRIGIAVTGSFCTFSKLLPYLKALKAKYSEITPIFSYSVSKIDTRFYNASDFYNDVYQITGKKPIKTIVDAEPIGPERLLDLLIIAPCTGNTLAKLNNGITDTPVLMSAKAHLRNDRPILIAISTNDGLSANAKNIGELMSKKNIFFVPLGQDNCIQKKYSLIANFDLLIAASEAALEGKQLQPIIISEE